MSTIAGARAVPSPSTRRLSQPTPPAYERVASLMLSATVVLGALVFCMLIIWLCTRVFVPRPPVPVEFVDLGGGTLEGVPGESLKMEGPLAEVVAPPVDQQQPELAQMLERVVSEVATHEAELDDPRLTEQDLSSGPAGGSDGTGDRRNYGLGPGDQGGVPAAQRWVVVFDEGATIDEYARQLDSFGIEIGAIGGTSQVIYVNNLAAGTPTVRAAQGGAEQRLYFTWRDGSRQDADRELLRRAGVEPAGKLIVHFYPRPTEELLFRLETDYLQDKAPGRDIRTVRRTRFGIVPQGQGYTFFVIDQSYL